MEFKWNLNKIHNDITKSYDKIKIDEGFDRFLGNYINLIIESGPLLDIKISKNDLNNNRFNWIYLSDPSDQTSIVEMTSSVDTFSYDVDNIFKYRKFDRNYLKENKL